MPYKLISKYQEPFQTSIYELDNGLRIYLSTNEEKPRIQTFIAVKAGFKDDPDDNTGLAHYLEHMIFKGSDRLGTSNWEKESELLESISSLFEAHKKESNAENKRKIYSEIDRLSSEAAAFAVPNDYDKLVSNIGAKGTNAYTSFDQTVYINDIPANELERWLKIESERFRKLVLRLFHTELETVYEEFNMRNQDSDNAKIFDAVMEGLFPHHTYGRQPSIGKAEHLKNPSMNAVVDFFNTYYVPNNMAICLSGDLDEEASMKLIDQYFGKMQASKLPESDYSFKGEMLSDKKREVWGNESESVVIAYPLIGQKNSDSRIVQIINGLLYNKRAGLLDRDLNQLQKVNLSFSAHLDLKDYSLLWLGAVPKMQQSLEEVESLLKEQIDKICKGDFQEWLLEAIVNDLRYKEEKKKTSNRGRANAFVDAFTNDISWDEYSRRLDALSAITKEQVVNFANKYLEIEPVVVYKRKGPDPKRIQLEKPPISSLKINRDARSVFSDEVMEMKTDSIEAEFLDFDKYIKKEKVNNIPLFHVHNTKNQIFKLHLNLSYGSDADPALGVVLEYLKYIGSKDLPVQDFKNELFKNGLDISSRADRHHARISIEGLQDKFENAVELLHKLISQPSVEEFVVASVAENILKKRADIKSDKDVILREALLNYARFGARSPFTNKLSEDDLRKLNPQTIESSIAKLSSSIDKIFYYGPDTVENLNIKLSRFSSSLEHSPRQNKKLFKDNPTQSRVYFVNQDMVQTELVLLHRAHTYDPEMMPIITLFNEYFGGGMSSLVYQEIRESKALAYSAFCYLNHPRLKDEHHYLMGYIATQADKLKEALQSFTLLLNDMPVSHSHFENMKQAVLRKMESERIIGEHIFWNNQMALDRGIDYDINRTIYEGVKNLSLEQLLSFYEKTIRNQAIDYLVIGNKESLNMDLLNQKGELKELEIQEIFDFGTS